MIFKSIRLKNFRQYKNEVEFNFSQPQNNSSNITLLIAANGVGKTTLLQAFRYCFYGKSSNYLNLPKSDELINNTLTDELKDLEDVIMFVEVCFTHDGIDYVARRESIFMKQKSLLRDTNEEKFSLSYLLEKKGYKPYKESEAYDKIRSILPEGLSQVFMFDGERMERNISDRAFSNELKESILGILDIKKYDKLIDILGNQGKSRSVIGKLASKKKVDNDEDKKNQHKYGRYQELKQAYLDSKSAIEEKIEEINQQIQFNKEQQLKLEENRERARCRDNLDVSINREIKELNDASKIYINNSREAIAYKLLLQNKTKYDDFVNMGRKHDNFYAYLHIDTIEDIQNKKICVCGRPISEHSEEFYKLENLKKTALPIESAQHLNLIDQKFKQCSDFKTLREKLNTENNALRQRTKKIIELKEEFNKLNQEIGKVEKQLGIKNQAEIDDLLAQKEAYLGDKGGLETQIRLCDEGLKKLYKKIQVIDGSNEYNIKINNVISIVERIQSKLLEIKQKKEKAAREILSENFNNSLSSVIHGSYDVRINEKYHVDIIDKNSNKEVTNLLSTGQNVVISLTFINALINTAKNLSEHINTDEKYGVIMDAALSNLDELHIDRLCKNTLNNMDQLIFLSYKRQLRDEMYQGIRENIGKAYVIKKHNDGHVYKSDINVNILEDYIHSMEEE